MAANFFTQRLFKIIFLRKDNKTKFKNGIDKFRFLRYINNKEVDMKTYDRLLNVTLDNITLTDIKPIKRVVNHKRNRIIECVLMGLLCGGVSLILNIFAWGTALISSILPATLSAIVGSGINCLLADITNWGVELRTDLSISEYRNLKKSGKLKELKKVLKEYQKSPMQALQKLEEKREDLQEQIDEVNRIIKTTQKKVEEYKPIGEGRMISELAKRHEELEVEHEEKTADINNDEYEDTFCADVD